LKENVRKKGEKKVGDDGNSLRKRETEINLYSSWSLGVLNKGKGQERHRVLGLVQKKYSFDRKREKENERGRKPQNADLSTSFKIFLRVPSRREDWEKKVTGEDRRKKPQTHTRGSITRGKNGAQSLFVNHWGRSSVSFIRGKKKRGMNVKKGRKQV